MERHRHNLPEWLVQPLKDQLGAVLAAGREPFANAPLDLRVNALKEKRADVQKELAKAAIKSVATPYSPWGLRIEGKPALTKLDAFTRGAIEVQDEGSQLLALLLDAKRGEMVVDFCAGAGGKTLAIGATMRSTGRLYAFDVSAHRLDALKPRLARSGLSNVHPAPLPTSATSASSAWPARSTACWWMRLARAWARCAATPTSNGASRQGACRNWWPSKPPSWTARAPAQAGRAAGVCHLQHPAAGKRGHCRGVQRRAPGFRAAGCR
jgi:hypothetical protein